MTMRHRAISPTSEMHEVYDKVTGRVHAARVNPYEASRLVALWNATPSLRPAPVERRLIYRPEEATCSA